MQIFERKKPSFCKEHGNRIYFFVEKSHKNSNISHKNSGKQSAPCLKGRGPTVRLARGFFKGKLNFLKIIDSLAKNISHHRFAVPLPLGKGGSGFVQIFNYDT